MEGVEETLRTLSIARRLRPEEPAYLLDVALQPAASARGSALAVTCSDLSLHLHDNQTLALLGRYQGHTDTLCGVAFAHASPDVLFSASADGTVRVWDARQPGAYAVRVLTSDASHRYCSFDRSCDDRLLCAGTEQVDEEDSFLVFWDARVAGTKEAQGAGVLGVYSESHSDDVTQVRFHPSSKDRLASGSTDGLVNLFDLSRGSEDEALLATCNSGSSASTVVWAGEELTRILCLTHDEGLHLWDIGRLDTDEPLTVHSVGDARQLSPPGGGGASVDYLVGGMWLEDARRLVVVGGASGGTLHLMECDDKGLRLLSSLQGGHTSTVRCFLWDAVEEALFTGGEDGQLLLWKPGGEELTPGKRETMKSDSVLKLRSRPHKRHGHERRGGGGGGGGGGERNSAQSL